MAGLSYPFDDGPGSSITEDQWSHMMRDAVGTGVHEPGDGTPGPQSDELLVFSLAEPGIVYVYPGQSTIQGFHYRQSGSELLAVTANNNVTQDRIDAVVLRLDLDTNAITLETKLGSPSGSPVPPSIADNELLLATYKVRKNSNTVLANEVTDMRTWVGRRVRISDSTVGMEGDVVYQPFSQRWVGLDGAGFSETFSFKSELDAHKAAADPHPQYLTAAEGNTAYNITSTNGNTTADLAINPAFTTVFGKELRMLNFPGGIKLVQLNIYMKFGGVEQDPSLWLATIDPKFAPSFSQRFVGQQWIFSNSGDSFPFIFEVRDDGQIQTTDTRIMNQARVVLNVMWLKGV